MKHLGILTLTLLLTIGLFGVVGCDDNDDNKVSAAPQRQAKPAPRQYSAPAPATASETVPARLGGNSIRVTLPEGGSVYIDKSAPSEVLVGKAFDYTIRLTNASKQTLQGVTLTGKLPENFKVIRSTPEATITGRNATWNVGDLSTGASKSFVVRGAATATGTLIACSDVQVTIPQACLRIRAVEPALKLTKTAPATRDSICEAIPYTLAVTNTGTGPATNVKISDTLPEGLSYKGKRSLTATVGTLGPGESKKINYLVDVKSPGTYTNQAVATADGDLRATAQAKTVVRQPKLTLTKTGPAKRYINRNVTYTLAVKNTGDGPAKNTVVSDTLPANATFVSASKGGSRAGNKVTWDLGTLKPGGEAQLSITLKASKAGTILNVAQATAVCTKANASAQTVVAGIPAILLECVDEEDPVEVGSQETYVIKVTNQGSAKDTNIDIVCTIPPEQTYVSSSGPTKATLKGNVLTFAPLPTLAPRAVATFKVITKGVRAGDSRFRVEMTTDVTTSPVMETESTNIYSDE